jgi:hypothetical protein
MQPFQQSQAPNLSHLRTASLHYHSSQTVNGPYLSTIPTNGSGNIFNGQPPYTYPTYSEPFCGNSLTYASSTAPPYAYLPTGVQSLDMPSSLPSRMSIQMLVEAPNTQELTVSASPATSTMPAEAAATSRPTLERPSNGPVASAWAMQNPLQPIFPARTRTSTKTSQSTAGKAQRAIKAAQYRSQQERRDQEVEKIHQDLEAAIEGAALRLGMPSLPFSLLLNGLLPSQDTNLNTFGTSCWVLAAMQHPDAQTLIMRRFII